MALLPVYNPSSTIPPPPTAPDEARVGDRLLDSHGRTIKDVRLSVTDRCNFRCVYCMDPDFRYMPKQELLSVDEYILIVRSMLKMGVTKVRITGGEPTLFAPLDELLGKLSDLGIPDLSMTTNGSLVTPERAKVWKQCGLDRLTFSLDSLKPERVKTITRADTTAQSVIDAINAARAAGLLPIKVNAVVVRNINDDELADFADFAREHDVDMRLIEFMPLDSEHAWSRDRVFSAEEMIKRIEERHKLVRSESDDPSSTSMNFTFADGRPGRIGMIAPVSRPFCGACSRLRITADGKVRPCLFSLAEWDLRSVLRNGGREKDITEFLTNATWTKQAGHSIGAKDFKQPERTMSSIGG